MSHLVKSGSAILYNRKTKLPWRGIFTYSTKETKLLNDLYCLLVMKQLIACAACERLPILRENILFMQYIHNSTNIYCLYIEI